MLKKIVLS